MFNADVLPRITVVTPSFNQGRFIEQTIQSVINQNYPNLEYIIIDGGSADNSLEIIKKYGNYLTFWESKKDQGQSDAIGKGFRRATGKLISWLNSDDMYFPGSLFKIAKAYLKNPKASIYSGGVAFGESNGLIVNCSVPSLSLKIFSKRGIFGYAQPSSFFNVETYKLSGGIDQSLYMRMDNDLMFRMLALNSNTVVIKDILGFFRFHGESKSSLFKDCYIKECAEFNKSIAISSVSINLLKILFKSYRLVSGGYLGSFLANILYKGRNIADFWQDNR